MCFKNKAFSCRNLIRFKHLCCVCKIKRIMLMWLHQSYLIAAPKGAITSGIDFTMDDWKLG